jgi:arylsulfatase A-like enzyme
MSKSEKPFFMWVHYMEPHEPYIPGPKILEEMYPSLSIDEETMFNLFENYVLKRDVSEPDKIELLRQLYAAHYREVDRFVEQFFSNLESLKLLDNTMVIITADHGDEFGEHGSLSHDSTMFSELIDIPLMIFNAGRSGLETRDQPVSNINIPPTVTDLLGVEPAAQWRGVSLLSPDEELPAGCWGECIHKKGESAKGETGKVRYYQEDGLKIIYRQKTDSWEMYDLNEDPAEQNDISTSAAASKMMARLETGFGQGQ